MENRRLKVSVGRTINTGDYESFRVDVGLEADIDDKTPFNEAYADLFSEVSKQLVVASETAKGKKSEEKRSESRYRGR